MDLLSGYAAVCCKESADNLASKSSVTGTLKRGTTDNKRKTDEE